MDIFLARSFGNHEDKEDAAKLLNSLEGLKLYSSAGKIEKTMSDRLLVAILSEDGDELLKSILEV